MASKKSSIAETWLQRIDKPRNSAHYLAVNRQAVGRMQDAAVDVKEYSGSYLYIFEDGSSLYEKHRDDWFHGSTYIRCPECEEWHEYDPKHYNSDICAECDEVAED